MEKRRLSFKFLVLILSTIVLHTSCQKINEATELGGNLIPEVDNITTFEASFSTETNNEIFKDSSRLAYGDNVALGNISNDPEFGKTTASIYFNISAPGTIVSTGANGTYPFTSRDNLAIDSVILSLSYAGAYGDTNSLQTVRVFEIAPSSTFSGANNYRFDTTAFETNSTELGSKSFIPRTLRDTISIIRKDTVKTANELRIRLNNSLGQRFASFDTAANANGGFYNDSLFNKLFKGFAIKADASTGNGLTYFRLGDVAKTKLTIYYKALKNGVADTASATFTHSRNGQANIINRTPAGGWAAYLNNGTLQDDKLYIQSAPGSLATIRVPALDTFRNNIVHRAELIISRIPSAGENLFTPPASLFLDKINNNKDTAFILQDDVGFNQDGSVNTSNFGGKLRSDNTYRFLITRHVQGIVSKNERNLVLRLSAPFEIIPFATNQNRRIDILNLAQIANGRVVVAGGNYADPKLQMRLRIVYSKI